MPEIFRLFGFTYYFFSREHEPVGTNSNSDMPAGYKPEI